MTLILEQSWRRTLDLWCEKIPTEFLPSDQIEIWLFDDEYARRAAEERMAAQGFHVRFRAAFKPLVHAFRTLRETPVRAQVIYPVSPHAVENRFLLEAYPLAALCPNLTFSASTDAASLHYTVTFTCADGRCETHTVFCPNRLVSDWGGLPALTPCGWLRVVRAGKTIIDRVIETDFESLFHAGMAAISAMPLADTQPFFEELRIEAVLPSAEVALGCGDEVVSYQEALHEEFYFSALEHFQHKLGLGSGDRSLQSGQIAPFIRFDPKSDCWLRVSHHALSRADVADTEQQSMQTASGPLSHAQIATVLEAVGGKAFSVTSRSGRCVSARYIHGSDQPVLISACQHGNETTGTVGALQAAATLAQQQNAHFVISPLENPDGNALFLRLLQDNPRHMHHAARYTAYGNDLQAAPDAAPAERGIRIQAQALSQAQLHLNLHGYPSHEWIRPLSGYIPRNFALWTLPKGFFLVLRHQAGFETLARALAGQVTQALADIAELMRLNQAQVDLYRSHAGELGFELVNGVPCSFATYPEARFVVELVTEFPDETIAGDAFRLGAHVQKTTVLAAYAAWQTLWPQG